MKPLNVELLLSHDSGISESYYRPTEKEVLKDYLKAVDSLTINDHNATLQKEITELTEKTKQENYIIKGQLAEKEKEIEAVKREADKMKQTLEDFIMIRQTQFEEALLAKYDRLRDEVMMRSNSSNNNNPDLVKGRNEKVHQYAIDTLTLSTSELAAIQKIKKEVEEK